MLTPQGHLTYCTNIHPGESWFDHFNELQKHIPAIKNKIAPAQSFGIGLRLSNMASLELCKEENLSLFQTWLKENDCYVFIMNGFPYGGFHHTRVKDKVHAPDWTTRERVEYTIRLAKILSSLLPDGMQGGISTSPLSYKYWHHENGEGYEAVFQKSTDHILEVAEQLIHIRNTTGKLIHLDIEPEPDGLLESGEEFIHWYLAYLIPAGTKYLSERLHIPHEEATTLLKDFVQLCYDVCHFAVGYEEPSVVLKQLKKNNIKTGRIQISAALKAKLSDDTTERNPVMEAFKQFNESTYLHQVIALLKDDNFKRYNDLPDALNDWDNPSVKEWRSHFHVPLFIEDYGVLQSTQSDIGTVLSLHKKEPFTAVLEVETYTWDVLPEALKLPIGESIVRELQWVKQLLASESSFLKR